METSNGYDSLRAAFATSAVTTTRLQTAPAGTDLATVPFELGRLTVVGGETGVGKSSLVHQQAVDAVLAGADGFSTWCVELTAQDIWRKQLARLSGVPVSEIPPHRKDFGPALRYAYEMLEEVADDIEFLSPDLSLRQIYERDLCGKILIIDYIQRLRVDGVSDARASMDQAMARLRELATAGRAVVIVSSLARGRTGIDAFRESGEIEYGADYAYVATKTADGGVLLTNVKNRWGALRDVQLAVDWPTMTFRDADPADESADNPPVWQPPKRGQE